MPEAEVAVLLVVAHRGLVDQAVVVTAFRQVQPPQELQTPEVVEEVAL